MPEQVKTQATIGTVDFRRTLKVIINRDTRAERRMSFADFEEQVTDIAIPPAAPEHVHDLLVTAKNLILYSWYYYPFATTASLQSMVAVEAALRIRIPDKPKESLKSLLKSAVAKGIITNDGFPRWKSYQTACQEIHGQPKVTGNFTKILIDTLPEFRNTMAHGNRYLDDSGFLHLDVACEAIAQLFPTNS